MKALLSFLVENIVENKKEVQITEQVEDGIKVFHLKVGAADMGKIIGKEGKVIKALRAALKVRSFATKERFQLSLEEAPAFNAEN
ncbi:MAG: hypothetical protein A3F35_02800 [Candidatus Woykebacteria bacterium RIFCSPHIGHO2_12_FULL_45_10]|uniref:RNA-binding protein KhpA n=1 Tax=Candidatus Woykebacteria bacterium RIFCSPHIGHO2_12_FULL_45_10 TaxID=1802603 RepID=A0A1G1WPG2_9BACT|nr:MAG: hypothetical protein A3F35_02800 [Candidatus Woykebacteria bacterium RIFCSPHIGHO2_12_FULL_45_10]